MDEGSRGGLVHSLSAVRDEADAPVVILVHDMITQNGTAFFVGPSVSLWILKAPGAEFERNATSFSCAKLGTFFHQVFSPMGRVRTHHQLRLRSALYNGPIFELFCPVGESLSWVLFHFWVGDSIPL